MSRTKRTKPSLLIMKGGGIKGIAYVGALEVLQDYYEFDWYAGTSAGAISAVLLGSGMQISQIKSILLNKNFDDFKDAGFFKKLYNLVTKRGLYEAYSFTSWLEKELSLQLDTANQVTLGMLPHRVTLYASTKSSAGLILDSSNDIHKDVPAAFAARCSMSIPLIFTPQYRDGIMVFDGGVQNNYPVEILLRNNPNTDFVGLYLGAEHFEGHKRVSIFKELISIWTESMDLVALKKYEDKTVVIDTRPISTLRFKLSDREKEFLLELGRLAAIKFLFKKRIISYQSDIYKEYLAKRDKLKRERIFLEGVVKKRKRKKRLITLIIGIPLIMGLSFQFFSHRKDGKETESSFMITVLVHGKEGPKDQIISGEGDVLLDFGSTREKEPINNEGEATFKEIPYQFLGTKARINIDHPQPYATVVPNQEITLKRNESYYLEIYLKGLNKINGRVWDFETEQVLDSVRVAYMGVSTYTDSFGWFELQIPDDIQSKFIGLDFFKPGYEYQKLDSITPHTFQEVEISLRQLK